MGKWDYGDAGDRWSVAAGDVWRLGDHVVACGDIELGDGAALLGTYGPADVAYVDPPWNAALATGFRTKANLRRRVNFTSFLRKLCATLSQVKRDVFIETAHSELFRLEGELLRFKGKVLGKWPITYYHDSTKVGALIHAAFGEGSALEDSPAGMDDDDTPAWCLQRTTAVNDTVVDLCLGRGLTLRAAHALNRRALGLELHPRRLAVAIDWAAKQGLRPERVACL